MVSPLFQNRDELKSRMRLGPSHAGNDTDNLIDHAIERVKVGLYERLGDGTVDGLLLIASDGSADTAEKRRRLRANTAEVLWVRALLTLDMPVLFMDTAGLARQSWNEEGLTRGLDRNAAKAEYDRLIGEVERLLTELLDEDEYDGSVTATVIGPDTAPPVPGASIF